MAKKSGREERGAMRRDVKQRQRAEAEAGLPLPRPELAAVFDFLDSRLGGEGCDHTLWLTREFLRERRVPEEPVVAWLGEQGGFHDCEVLANVEDEWGAGHRHRCDAIVLPLLRTACLLCAMPHEIVADLWNGA